MTLVCFAVKEEAAPFKAALASRPDIQVLLTGMGQRNAEKSLRSALPRTAAVSETSRRNVPNARDSQTPNAAAVLPLPKGEGRGEGEQTVHQPSIPENITPPLHHSTTPSLVLTCGFAGGLNPELPI